MGHVLNMPMNASTIYVNIRAKSDNFSCIIFMKVDSKYKGKAVPLQDWTGPGGSRKLRFPDFMTTAQDGGRLSALRTARLYS